MRSRLLCLWSCESKGGGRFEDMVAGAEGPLRGAELSRLLRHSAKIASCSFCMPSFSGSTPGPAGVAVLDWREALEYDRRTVGLPNGPLSLVVRAVDLLSVALLLLARSLAQKACGPSQQAACSSVNKLTLHSCSPREA